MSATVPVVARISLRIAEVYCPSCAVDIETHLRRLDGVHRVQVDLAGQRMEVDYVPALLDVEDVIVTIGGAGAHVRLTEDYTPSAT
ncbi:heavy metal transport/detoxification protein [Kocuria rosea]|uniref:cation transporter n=1 Tax=Kocuria rosea TaxID=1275 RepID=UPI000D6566A4|nr:heavy metal-associated domain-containing protein [Kocuria rosea]PWF82737.1 heavy metal transport/detoxification protein [Kocuria rosea]QCY32945.1 heavy-metal-associated domain-containing protein [Kocuria rosea]TQN33669.1 copper chaperone CopZ [Kocuria rosea]